MAVAIQGVEAPQSHARTAGAAAGGRPKARRPTAAEIQRGERNARIFVVVSLLVVAGMYVQMYASTLAG